MVLEESTIQEIKSKSGLEFNKVKDFVALSDLIMKTTGRSIGTTTLKRLMGNITDTRKANPYTLDTIAQYLGFTSWNAYSDQVSNDSLWNYPDQATGRSAKSSADGHLRPMRAYSRSRDRTP